MQFFAERVMLLDFFFLILSVEIFIVGTFIDCGAVFFMKKHKISKMTVPIKQQ